MSKVRQSFSFEGNTAVKIAVRINRAQLFLMFMINKMKNEACRDDTSSEEEGEGKKPSLRLFGRDEMLFVYGRKKDI